MRLDSREKFPSGMEDYLSQYGWHFSKKMCEYATSRMYKKDSNGKKTYISPWSKDSVDNLLYKYNIKVENKTAYDYVYVANMALADFMNSSIMDEQHLALYIKDYVDDPDAYSGMPFTRYYADCIGSGNPINWEDML